MPAVTLLHLSDLHFGAARAGAQYFEKARAVTGILEDVVRMRQKLRKPGA